MAQSVIQPEAVHETLRKYMLADGYEMVFDYEKSKGPYFHDALSGKDYLDFFCFFASQPITYNHPKMNDGYFQKKAKIFGAIKPANSDIYTTALAEFVETFHRVAIQGRFKYSFFVSGGALAVENALKVAMDWKVRKNLANGKGERGTKIMHFKEAFHGRSGYTLSLTNTHDPNKYKYFSRFDWPRIINPKCFFPLEGDRLNQTIELENQAKQQIESYLQKEGDEIAAIIIEPIQAEGGDNHFRPEFFAFLREVADSHEVLLIMDEVQTGLGATGKMWGYEHTGIKPDIISFGKKVQVCGIAVTDRIDDVPEHVFHTSSRINSTWGGNAIDMVRSTRYLEIIEEENLVEHTRKLGEIMMNRLEQVQTSYAEKISNLRGKGTMIAFDLPSESVREQFIERCNQNQLLPLSCGERTIRLRPFLDMPEADALKGIDIMERVIKQL